MYTECIDASMYTECIDASTFTECIYASMYTECIYASMYTECIYASMYTECIYASMYTYISKMARKKEEDNLGSLITKKKKKLAGNLARHLFWQVCHSTLPFTCKQLNKINYIVGNSQVRRINYSQVRRVLCCSVKSYLWRCLTMTLLCLSFRLCHDLLFRRGTLEAMDCHSTLPITCKQLNKINYIVGNRGLP